MRTLLLSILISSSLIACSKDADNHIDASIHVVDAKPVDGAPDARPDAPPDAAPDAPNMNVVTACMHACDALGVCVMMPADADCYSGCAEDLVDCTDAQVAAVDACSTEACGDIQNNNSPLITCLTSVSCVELAFKDSRK
ncbi:MAG TPA: hypothetical protein VIV40_32225 [Kofleriaceae bacterium]